MSVGYRAISWNRQKVRYDLVLGGGILAYLAVFVAAGLVLRPRATIETLLIRALGTCGLLLLHVVLSIGPLCRIEPRLLPLLYNRRHLGVATFLVGAAHAALSLFQFHALAGVDPLVSLVTANLRWGSLAQFPFEILGLVALAVLFLLAATSHDFWLHNLTAPVWKRLHMLVYAAWGLLVLHVVLGVLQAETDPWLAVVLAAGVVWVVGLHLVAGWRERTGDRERTRRPDGLVDVCGVDEIPEKRARVVTAGSERVAVFRYDGCVAAVSNVCQHQNGPLGEGRIRDGCITCPWHGYQYLPETGASPPPFTERVPTFRLRIERGRVLLDPRPCPAGARVEPARIDGGPAAGEAAREFYVGYEPVSPPGIARRVRRAVALLAALAVAVPLLLVSRQDRFDPGSFEFGVVRGFQGRVEERPYPSLLVPRPGRTDGSRAWSSYPLVAFGKHGAQREVAGLDGVPVRLRGSLIYRQGRTMIEISGPVERLEGVARRAFEALPEPTTQELGAWTLVGEIVDSKCFLGVMKPGRAKTHRACAARCIAGGIPPLFVVRDRAGNETAYLLVDADGRPVSRDLLDLVGEPVEIRGRVSRAADRLVLRADPAGYRRAAGARAQSQTAPESSASRGSIASVEFPKLPRAQEFSRRSR